MGVGEDSYRNGFCGRCERRGELFAGIGENDGNVPMCNLLQSILTTAETDGIEMYDYSGGM
jgi:hypothetical protein